MRIPICHIDAFTSLSETAFFVRRSGELWCKDLGDRVIIQGRPIEYLVGTIRF